MGSTYISRAWCCTLTLCLAFSTGTAFGPYVSLSSFRVSFRHPRQACTEGSRGCPCSEHRQQRTCASWFEKTRNQRSNCLGFNVLTMSKLSEGLSTGATPKERLTQDNIRGVITSNPRRSIAFSVLISVCGATLGPFLDSYHSAFGVLRYDEPISLVLPLLGGTAEHPALTTAWWVPELFGLAGFIIGWLYVVLDSTLEDSVPRPTPPIVLMGISLFTFQYWFSGFLFQSGYGHFTMFMVMTLLGGLGFQAFDRTKSGFITSLATAVGGPLIELGLISTLSGHGGYHYQDPGETGFFPLWILPVYFLGGPAVGNLARGIWNALEDVSGETCDGEYEVLEDSDARNNPRNGPNCQTCNDTRAVGCPNCDAEGYYVTYSRRVRCNCCKGRGLVICRDCFSDYGNDPLDIDEIREIMSKIPD